MKLEYYKNLDGVRAIAALMVIIFHFFQGIKPNSNALYFLDKISVFGQTGVTLFFVLSGFLITRILINTKETEGYFKNFYLRRTLRIFPLYYFFLFLTYYITPLLFNSNVPSFNQQIYYYTYLQNFATTFNWNAKGPSHFWSLAVEEHFYLFWPFIVFLFSPKNLKKVIFGIIIGALLLRIIMVNNGFNVFYFTFTRFDSLAIGALLALIELKNHFSPDKAKYFLMSLVGVLIPTIIMWTFFNGSGENYIQIFKYLFISFIYFSLIGFLLCLKSNNFINQILKTKFFSFTGKISYGLYVYHPLAFFICAKFINSNNFSLYFVVSIFITYVISILSFHFIETPFLKWKKYFEYKRKIIKPRSIPS